MKVYRVLPWNPKAAADEAGGVFYAPRSTANRISNPDLYRELYLAMPAEASVAEALGDLAVWRLSTFRCPIDRLALATYELKDDEPVVDLDDVTTLRNLGIERPSRVVTPDRRTTQAWARRIYELPGVVGVRWWSHYNAEWTAFPVPRFRSAECFEGTPVALDIASDEVAKGARAIVKQRIVQVLPSPLR